MSEYPKEFAKHFIGVGGICIHKNKVLLVKLNYGKAKGFWMIPGGFLDQGETLLEAVKREILEETGLEVDAEGVLSVRTMVRNSDNTTDLYSVIKCKLISKPEDLKAQESEIDQVIWMPIEDCFTNKEVSDYTKQIIKRTLNTNSNLVLDKPISEKRKKRFDLSKYEEFWVEKK